MRYTQLQKMNYSIFNEQITIVMKVTNAKKNENFLLTKYVSIATAVMETKENYENL